MRKGGAGELEGVVDEDLAQGVGKVLLSPEGGGGGGGEGMGNAT